MFTVAKHNQRTVAKNNRRGVSTFVAIIISVIIAIAIGGLLLASYTGYFSGATQTASVALNGQLQTITGGAGVLTITVRNTGTVSVDVDGSDLINFPPISITGPGNVNLTIVSPTTLVSLTPGDSVTIQANVAGGSVVLQTGAQYILVISFTSTNTGSANSQQLKLTAT